MPSKTENIEHNISTEPTRRGWFNAWMKFFEENTPSGTTEKDE